MAQLTVSAWLTWFQNRGNLAMYWRHWAIRLLVLSLVGWTVQSRAAGEAESNWGQWRGPAMTGVAPIAHPPLMWSETENVRWKTPIPGRGLSSPVIWNDLVFVTTSVASGEAISAEKLAELQKELPDWVLKRGARLPRAVHDFILIAINRQTGASMWPAETAPLQS